MGLTPVIWVSSRGQTSVTAYGSGYQNVHWSVVNTKMASAKFVTP